MAHAVLLYGTLPLMAPKLVYVVLRDVVGAHAEGWSEVLGVFEDHLAAAKLAAELCRDHKLIYAAKELGGVVRHRVCAEILIPPQG